MATTLMSVTATNTSAPPTPRTPESEPLEQYTRGIHINNINYSDDLRTNANVGRPKNDIDDVASTFNYDGCDAENTPVLLNIFLIRKKRYRVFYNAGKLVWERYQSKKGRISVPVANILAINPQNSDNSEQDAVVHASTAIMPINITGADTSESTETISVQPVRKQFTIVYARRSQNSTNLNKWRYVSITLHSTDAQVVDSWTRTLQNELNAQTLRPKRLLLFVNPYGGKKRALQIYDCNVKPIFQIAGIDASVVISQRSNQIRDFIMTQSLEHFDGIVCIGGDGTFSEVFNGLIFRTMKDEGLDGAADVLDRLPKIKMPIGVIPAGSTDTVAYCLNGTTDIQTNVLNIVLGQINGLDLSSVSNQNGLMKFYASVMSYGFLGDVAIESEKFRWMGPKRYDYSGFKKLLLNRGYEGEITMQLAPSDNTPAKGPACLENCQMCLSNERPSTMMTTTTTSVTPHSQIANKVNNQTNRTATVITNTDEKFGDSNENENHTSSSKYSLFKKSAIVTSGNKLAAISSLKNYNNATNNGGHTIEHNDETMLTAKTINGKFFMVNGANISCACSRSPNGFSKYCHLCDGYIDLILVRHTTFFNNIKLLLAMSSQNCTISELPHVEIYRTRKFSFRPNGLQTGVSTYNLHSSRMPISSSEGGGQHTSVWNCDGEVLHDSEVSIRSHRHLINVYRRGLYNAQMDEIDAASTASCCGLCIT